jgi:hypothetical protein
MTGSSARRSPSSHNELRPLLVAGVADYPLYEVIGDGVDTVEVGVHFHFESSSHSPGRRLRP